MNHALITCLQIACVLQPKDPSFTVRNVKETQQRLGFEAVRGLWLLGHRSVAVISPQDAATAQQDVMENHHLYRPQALECSLAGPTNISTGSEGKGADKSTNRELAKSLKEGEWGGVLITNVKVSYVSYLSQQW